MENKVYYKILNHEMNHHGFQYKLGLNIDTEEFNPSGSCEKGGLYFTTAEFLYMFVSYGCFVAEITIPKDAKVYTDPQSDKWKANKIFITKIEHVSDMSWLFEKHKNELLEKSSRFILLFEQTYEHCLEAVKKNGGALQYIKDQTPELCLEAVKENGWALEYVKEQTPEICLEAVKENGLVLYFVKKQTPELCLEAVKRNGYSLPFVKEQTPEICLEAVKRQGNALQFVKKQTREICLEAIKRNEYASCYVKINF